MGSHRARPLVIQSLHKSGHGGVKVRGERYPGSLSQQLPLVTALVMQGLVATTSGKWEEVVKAQLLALLTEDVLHRDDLGKRGLRVNL